MIDRRTLLNAAAATLAAGSASARTRPTSGSFPSRFLWGAATAGHQVEGNNVASDIWRLENTTPTVFAERSGDAVNNLELWSQDLDIVKAIGLNTYRFSLEWARIEPEEGAVSIAMLDHYKRIIDGCHARGLTPFVTYNHFAAPDWFSAAGGWTNPEAASKFAGFCGRATRHMGDGIDQALTMNEPNLMRLLRMLDLPPPLIEGQRAMLAAAARAAGTVKYVAANVAMPEDDEAMLAVMIDGHRQARAAIKAEKSTIQVGVSLAMADDQAVGDPGRRDAARAFVYGAWLETARDDDFIGVQNYERILWGPDGRLPAPAGGTLNFGGSEVYAPSLAGAVRYAHAETGKPVYVTEHGVGTDDDAIRAAFIPASLSELKIAIDEGVPVKGYIHWSLLDNFEWIFGYGPHFGLVSVDRTTFERTPKASAQVLGSIARRNSL